MSFFVAQPAVATDGGGGGDAGDPTAAGASPAASAGEGGEPWSAVELLGSAPPAALGGAGAAWPPAAPAAGGTDSKRRTEPAPSPPPPPYDGGMDGRPGTVEIEARRSFAVPAAGEGGGEGAGAAGAAGGAAPAASGAFGGPGSLGGVSDISDLGARVSELSDAEGASGDERGPAARVPLAGPSSPPLHGSWPPAYGAARKASADDDEALARMLAELETLGLEGDRLDDDAATESVEGISQTAAAKTSPTIAAIAAAAAAQPSQASGREEWTFVYGDGSAGGGRAAPGEGTSAGGQPSDAGSAPRRSGPTTTSGASPVESARLGSRAESAIELCPAMLVAQGEQQGGGKGGGGGGGGRKGGRAMQRRFTMTPTLMLAAAKKATGGEDGGRQGGGGCLALLASCGRGSRVGLSGPRSILLTPQRKAVKSALFAESNGGVEHRVAFEVPRDPRKGGVGWWQQLAAAPDVWSPDEAAPRMWERAMLLPLSFEMFALPYRLALGSPGFNMLLLVDLCADAIHVVDAAVALNTAIARPGEQQSLAAHGPRSAADLITSRRAIALAYLHGRFWYTLAPAALLYLFAWLCAPGGGIALPVGLWYVSSLPRLQRGQRLIRYFRKAELELEIDVRTLQIYKFGLMISLTAHWVGCLFYFLSRVHDFSHDTWVSTYSYRNPNFDPGSSSSGTAYVVLLYKGFNAVANLGLEAVIPNTRAEMAFSILVIMLQVVLTAYILGTIFHYLVRKDVNNEAHRKTMQDLHAFTAGRELPAELREELTQHFEFQHSKAHTSLASARMKLTRSLRVKVANANYGELLDRCRQRGQVFHGLSDQFVNAILLMLKEQWLMPGEEFTRAGEMSRELYFVSSGRCEVLYGNAVHQIIRADVADVPSLCGEVPFFLGIPQRFSVRAHSESDVQLLTIPRQAYEDLVAQNYPEQHEVVVSNILHRFGLDKYGANEAGGQSGDDDDKLFKDTRESIRTTILRRNRDDFATLSFAASNGDVEVVRQQLRRGMFDAMDYDKRTALHLAAMEGNYQVVDLLINECGNFDAFKNARDRWGRTALQAAIDTRQVPVADLLLHAGCAISVNDPPGEMCAAAFAGDVDTLRRMVENGISKDVADIDGRTPLHVAAAEGQEASVEYLLNIDAEVNTTDRRGHTPLLDAVLGGHGLVVRLIRTHQGMLCTEEKSRRGADLLCEAAKNGDKQTLELLVHCGTEIDATDYNQRCALHLAAAGGRLLSTAFLLSASANPNAVDGRGCTPLVDALRGDGMYHMYCALLICAYGGTLGALQGTAEGDELMAKLDGATIDDARLRIRYMLERGMGSHKRRENETRDMLLGYHEDTMEALVAEVGASRVLGSAAAVASRVSQVVRARTRRLNARLLRSLEAVQKVIDMSVYSASESTLAMPARWRTWVRAVEEARTTRVIEEFLRESEALEAGPLTDGAAGAAALAAPSSLRRSAIALRLMSWDGGEGGQDAQGAAGGGAPGSNAGSAMSQNPDTAVGSSERAASHTATEDDEREFMMDTDVYGATQDEFDAYNQADDLFNATIEAIEGERASGRQAAHAGGGKEGSGEARRIADKRSLQTSCRQEAKAFQRHVIQSLFFGQCLDMLKGCAHGSKRQLRRASLDLSAAGLLDEFQAPPVESPDRPSPRKLPSVVVASPAHTEDDLKFTLATAGYSDDPQDDDGVARVSVTTIGVFMSNLGVETSHWDRQWIVFDCSREADGVLGAETGRLQDVRVPVESLLLCPAFRKYFLSKKYVAEFKARAEAGDTAGNPNDFKLVHKALQLAEDCWGCFARVVAAESDMPHERHVKTLTRSGLALIRHHIGEVGEPLFKELFPDLNTPDWRGVQKREFYRRFVAFMSAEMDEERQVVNETAGALRVRQSLLMRSFTSVQESFSKLVVSSLTSLRGGMTEMFGKRSIVPHLFTAEALELYEPAFVALAGSLEKLLPGNKLHAFLMRVCPHFARSHGIRAHHIVELLQALEVPVPDVASSTLKEAEVPFSAVQAALQKHRAAMMTSAATRVPTLVRGEGSASPVLHPQCTLAHVWRAVMRVLAVYLFVMVPLRIAFEPWRSYADLSLHLSESTVDVLLLCNILVEFNTGYLNDATVLITSQAAIRRRYLSTGFISDVVTSIPLDAFAIALGSDFTVTQWLRLPKMLRVIRAWREYRANAKQDERLIVQSIMPLLMLMVGLLHLLACAWFYFGAMWAPAPGLIARHETWFNVWFDVPYMENPAPGSHHLGIGSDATLPDKYLLSFYWVASVVSGSGLVGDVLPVNNIELVFSLILMALHLTFFSFVLGEISNMVMQADDELVQQRESLNVVNTFIGTHRLTAEVEREVRQHFYDTNQSGEKDQGALFAMLSHQLQVKVARCISRDFLNTVSLFKRCSDSFMDSISVLLREVEFAPEEYAFRNHEVCREMFLVRTGLLEITLEDEDGSEVIEGTVKPGDAAGDLAFFFGMRHFSGARAVNRCVCFTLQRADFVDMMKLFPEEERAIQANALRAFDRITSSSADDSKSVASASSYARSQGGTSEGASSRRSSNASSHIDASINPNLRASIAILKKRRRADEMYRLLTAASIGDVHVVAQHVAEATAGSGDLDARSSDGRTALHVAASSGQAAVVKLLLEGGADPFRCDKHGSTALVDAVREGHDECIRLLRERTPGLKFELGGSAGKMQTSVLMTTFAAHGQLEQLKRLLDADVPINLTNYDGRTALHLAASHGQMAVVEHLLGAGCEVDPVDRFGATPLLDALHSGHRDVQRRLCAAGARLRGLRVGVLMCQTAAMGKLQFLQDLLDCGVDSSEADFCGRTALHMAAMYGRVDLMYMLIRHEGIDINPVDIYGSTPLNESRRHDKPVSKAMLKKVGALAPDDSKWARENPEAHAKSQARFDAHCAQRRRAADDRAKLIRAELRGKRQTVLPEADLLANARMLVRTIRLLAGVMNTHLVDVEANLDTCCGLTAEQLQQGDMLAAVASIDGVYGSTESIANDVDALSDTLNNVADVPAVIAGDWKPAAGELGAALAELRFSVGVTRKLFLALRLGHMRS